MSAAKDEIIAFLTITKTADMHVFTIPGDENEARRFVQCMRQELSRMRDKVKRRRHYPKPFKMILHELIHDPISNTTRVSLTRNRKNELITDAMKDVFEELDGGPCVQLK